MEHARILIGILKPKQACLAGRCLSKRNKAQSTLEYAVIIVCLVAALLAMRVYIKRAMQGRFRESADQLGQQYSPQHTSGTTFFTNSGTTNTTVTTKSEAQLSAEYHRNVDLDGNGIPNQPNVYGTETVSEIPQATPEVTTQTGSENVGPLSEENLF